MASLACSILFTACLFATATAQSPSASQLVPFQRLYSFVDDINYYTTSDGEAASMNVKGFVQVTPRMGSAVKVEEINAVRAACPNVTFAALRRVAFDMAYIVIAPRWIVLGPHLLGYAPFSAECGANLAILEYRKWTRVDGIDDFIYVVANSSLHHTVAADSRYWLRDTVFYVWST